MIPGRRARTAGRGQRGQGLTEFALAFPIAILVIIAVFDAGRAVFVYNGLTNAAREGARLAIVNQNKPLVGQRVQNMAFGSGISNIGNLNDLVSFYREGPNLTDPTTNASCATLAVGCIAVVQARTTWSAITPLVGALIGPINFVARSELPVEFVCPNPSIPAYATPASCPRQP